MKRVSKQLRLLAFGSLTAVIALMYAAIYSGELETLCAAAGCSGWLQAWARSDGTLSPWLIAIVVILSPLGLGILLALYDSTEELRERIKHRFQN